MAEQHPHEAWQSAVFGCAHISQHRTLHQHVAAMRRWADLLRPIPREEQVARLHTMDAGFAHDLRERHQPFDPVHEMVRGAQAYNRGHNFADPHAMPYHQVRTNSHTIDQVGTAYGALPDFDKASLPHFHAMGEEVGRQFDHLTGPRNRGGLGIHVESVDHDPYPTVHHMVKDLRENGRMKVLGTHVTGGHPYFSNDQNDRFRAVHDAFGHAATGRGFDASGEEAAYLAHSRMFSHHALPAMQSETRGQNGFVHLNNDFGPQKVAVLPEHIRNIPVIGGNPQQHAAKATDWDEYRRIQDAQDRRYERPGTVGGQEEHDQFYGRGEHAGAGTEHRLTPQEWMRHSHEPSFDELPEHEHEWHRGHDLGMQHSTGVDDDEFDHAYESSTHPDHFFSGYTEGLRSVASTNPLSTPQDAVAFEEGKQNVRDIKGVPLCDWHTDRAKEQMGLSDQIGRQTGLIDENEPHTHTETTTYPGRCAACAMAQIKNEGRPWDASPDGGFRPSPMSEFQVPRRSWPNKPKRTGPFMPLPQSMSRRVAVRRGQKPLDPATIGLQRIAHKISTDMPDVVVLRKVAHDSGDGQTILHCPFCGSGQVIATSDGGVECEFCFSGDTEYITWDGVRTLKETVGTVQRVLVSQSFRTQIAKGRSRQGQAPKITDEQVIEIRDLYAAGSLKAELGRQFGVTQGTIKAIVERRTRQHLGGGGHESGERVTQEATWGDGHAPFGGIWVDAEIRSFGTQRLHRVVLTRQGIEKVVHATAEHRWYIHPKKGSWHRPDHKVVKTTVELSSNDRLPALFPQDHLRQNRPTTPSPFGIAHGFTFGDGSLTGRGGANVVLWGEKDANLLPYFSANRTRELTNKNGTKGVEVKDLPAFFKEYPSRSESLSYRYGWLAGYFAADGSVSATGTAQLACADREVLEWVRGLALQMGIGTYGISEFSRTGFEGREETKIYYLSFVAGTLTPEFFLIPEHRKRFEARKGNQDTYGWTVVSVEETDREEEVFCAVVPGYENFTLAGNINVMNCRASFTVQVQPQYPAFPQSIDGAPVNVPGMGPDFSQYGGTPPGEEAPMPMEGEEDDGDESGNNPFAEGEDETEPPEEDGDEDEDSGGGGNPFTKKSYVTTTGARLDHEAYLKHLALNCSPDPQQTLRRVRAMNGT